MFAAHNAFFSGAIAKLNPALKGITGNDGNVASFALPTHAVGDLILVAAYGDGPLPSAPSAGGTVPTWTTIGSPPNSIRMAYTIATATNHTLGTWAAGYVISAAVISNPGATPIGGSAYGSYSSSTTAVAPAITLGNSTGSSLILHISFRGNAPAGSTPAGYTKVLDVTGSNYGYAIRALTKNVTTTDGSVTVMTEGSAYSTASVSLEILA